MVLQQCGLLRARPPFPNLNSMRPGNCWVTVDPTQNIMYAPIPCLLHPLQLAPPGWLVCLENQVPVEEGAEGWPGSSISRGHLSIGRRPIAPGATMCPTSWAPNHSLLPRRAQSHTQSHVAPSFPTSGLTPGAFRAHLCSSSSLVRKLWPPGFCNQGRNVIKAGAVPGPVSSRSLMPHCLSSPDFQG